jgi:predicted phosphodiesterase
MILGFLSDAHGNREAFEQGLSLLLAGGADTVYFLGDAVGYLPGDGVVDAIRETGVIPILGNHDARLLSGEIDPERDEIQRLRDTFQAMPAANRAFLETWPDHRLLESDFGKLLLVHGSPADPVGGYVYPNTDLGQFATVHERAVFMGQTHRPFVRSHGETAFINVGSCGLPRDCGHLGAACLFDDTSGMARIIRFDIRDATTAALRRCGPVAPEVRAVFARRSPGGCYGT